MIRSFFQHRSSRTNDEPSSVIDDGSSISPHEQRQHSLVIEHAFGKGNYSTSILWAIVCTVSAVALNEISV